MWEGSGERAQRQWPWRKPAASGRVISQRQAGLRGGGSRSRGVPFRDVLRLRVALLRPVLAQCGVRAHPPPGAGEQTTLSALQGLQDKSQWGRTAAHGGVPEDLCSSSWTFRAPLLWPAKSTVNVHRHQHPQLSSFQRPGRS
ncbi:centromere protein X isoform X1 [Meriones unguiculatus]|uniref:centromere protein X isoform X1 n=1 Tax=Meriones unguiculatus TaxID=10047 RepID=UPI00293EEC9E|nr:centromere protein X isoform X1 [Meriones unguiculatus]